MNGNGVSPGVAVAKALVLKQRDVVVPVEQATDTAGEWAAFESALTNVRQETTALYEKTLRDLGKEQAAVFEAHEMILSDEELLNPIESAIRSEGKNAAHAVQSVLDSIVSLFEHMDDVYFRERAADIRDIEQRLIDEVLGRCSPDLSVLKEDCIIVAHDLTPSNTAKMDLRHVRGLVTESGGRTSHTAIMARSLEIPAIVSVRDAVSMIKSGNVLAIDGDKGEVVLNPDRECVDKYELCGAELRAQRLANERFRDQPSVTRDGHRVQLFANIGTPDEIERVLQNGAEGIGLFRTEFLYLNRDQLPGEEEQTEAYGKILSAMEGKPVIIRTLDIGGDKQLGELSMGGEENPFLGCRAIRLCFEKMDVFKTQLRALLRASCRGNLRIMFPMISSLEELSAAKVALEEARQELNRKGVAFSSDIQVGMMVEIPAAALLADFFAREVDFFSIGSNDLVQYTVAVDRGNEKVAHLYSYYHPAVLRLIRMTINAAHANGIECGMCGEAAGDELFVKALIGLGLDEFSMSASSILKIRGSLLTLNCEECRKAAFEVAGLPTADAVRQYLERIQ